MSPADLHLLRPAIEAALGVARQGEAADPPVPAPPVLRPFLSFSRLPGTALAVARRVIDDDEDFRLRVRDATSEIDVGPLGWLWLDRPAGWEAALAEAAAVADAGPQRSGDDVAGSRRQGGRSSAGDVAAARAGGRGEVRARQVAAELERLKAETAELRRANRRLAAELERTEAQVVELTEERTRAVRQLKAAEAGLAERAAESGRYRDEARVARRRLEDALDELARAPSSLAESSSPGPQPSGVAAPQRSAGRAEPAVGEPAPAVADLPRAADTLVEASQAAGRLAAALADLAGALVPGRTQDESSPGAARRPALPAPQWAPGLHTTEPAEPTGPVEPAEPTGAGDPTGAVDPTELAEPTGPAEPTGAVDPTGPAQPTRPTGPSDAVVGRWPVRRRPVRLVRGAVDDTPPAAENLARLPDVVFLVDGYNVSKTAWPDLDLGAQRLRLVNAVAELRVRLGTRIELVFDGTARGQLQTRALPAAVRVWFSPEEVEADDLILSLVDEQPPDRPVVVVSSDRRVQDGARRRGASVLSSATFLCLLR